ncbi:MAG: hypothetical protein ACRBCI_04190 [Cellvibrionaceae bacterium]
MEWEANGTHKVIHRDGHFIELIEGTWHTPLNIHPHFSGDVHPIIAAQLLRRGLRFAAINSLDCSHSDSKKKSSLFQKIFADIFA